MTYTYDQAMAGLANRKTIAELFELARNTSAIRARSPTSFSKSAPLRPAIDTIVASLIALGVPEATRFEDELSKL